MSEAETEGAVGFLVGEDCFEFPVFSNPCDQICAALAAAQQDIENAKKNSDNPFHKSKYADLAAVFEACKPALAANQIFVTQPPTRSKRGDMVLVTRLVHTSGQWIQGVLPLHVSNRLVREIEAGEQEPAAPMAPPMGGGDEGQQRKKKRSGAQDVAAEITYMRRAGLAALAGVAAEEDDDGNAAQEASSQRPAIPRATSHMGPAMGGPPTGPPRMGPPR